MDSLKRMMAQIAERFRLLETSQKVAISLCIVVIVGSLISLMKWSTAPELVPLLAQDFTFDQMDAAEQALTTAGVKFSRAGSRLLVHEEDRYTAIRVLNTANALPEDFEFGYEKLMAEDSTFKPASVLEHQRQIARDYELAKVIQSSPVVQDAFVITQQQDKRALGQPRVKPSASVKLTMKPGQAITPSVVEGCAKLVAHAVPGLSTHDVTVFDTKTLKAHTVPSPEELFDTGLLAERKRIEDHFQKSVVEHFSYIRGILVAVSVELDPSKTRTESLAYGEADVKSEETKTSKSGSASTPGEPGVSPNVGVALSAGGSGGPSETEESHTENFEPKLTERRVEDRAPFGLKRATAAINLPRSYLVGMFKVRYPDKNDPRDTDREFADLRTELFTGIREAVKTILHVKADADVQVDVFYDPEPGGGAVPGVPGGEGPVVAAMTTLGTLKSYAPQLGLGGLALLSLGMMVLMVRKTTRTARSVFPMSEAEEKLDNINLAADGILAVPGRPVGRAEVSEGFLIGHEVDQETLQNKQLDEQVARLVDDDPTVVADLLRRWVEQEE